MNKAGGCQSYLGRLDSVVLGKETLVLSFLAAQQRTGACVWSTEKFRIRFNFT